MGYCEQPGSRGVCAVQKSTDSHSTFESRLVQESHKVSLPAWIIECPSKYQSQNNIQQSSLFSIHADTNNSHNRPKTDEVQTVLAAVHVSCLFVDLNGVGGPCCALCRGLSKKGPDSKETAESVQHLSEQRVSCQSKYRAEPADL